MIPFDVVPERVGYAEISKYFDVKIDALRVMIERRPQDAKVNSYESTQWQRKFAAYYGKILGGLEVAVDFKLMPVAMQKNLEQKLKRMLQYHTSVLIIGQG